MSLEKLKAIASAATPGPWFPCGARYTIISRELNEQEIEDVAEVCNHFRDENQIEKNKIHISTFNPKLVLALLEEIEAARNVAAAPPIENEEEYDTWLDKRQATDELLKEIL